MKYQILTAVDAKELEEKVNAAIATGWQPLGGVSVTEYIHSTVNERKGSVESKTHTCFVQAITKNSENEFGKSGALESGVDNQNIAE